MSEFNKIVGLLLIYLHLNYDILNAAGRHRSPKKLPLEEPLSPRIAQPFPYIWDSAPSVHVYVCECLYSGREMAGIRRIWRPCRVTTVR